MEKCLTCYYKDIVLILVFFEMHRLQRRVRNHRPFRPTHTVTKEIRAISIPATIEVTGHDSDPPGRRVDQ